MENLIESPRNRQRVELDSTAKVMARDVKKGLCEQGKQKSIPYRFLYDEYGSRLFEEICDLPEYYLTRAEDQILRDHVEEIVNQCTSSCNTTMIELGSGSSTKTRTVIEEFLRKHGTMTYVPIDISPSALEESSSLLREAYPNLKVTGVVTEYLKGLRKVNDMQESGQLAHGHDKLVLWLGSSIGNFDKKAATEFLSILRQQMKSGDKLLIGIDLVKDKNVLEDAYDDAQGVTSSFNMNLLKRLNRELGASFRLTRFKHRAMWNETDECIEMHLVSQRAQTVSLLDEHGEEYHVSFKEGESIHTESSHKYRIGQIGQLAKKSRFTLRRTWLDRENKFSLNLFVLDGERNCCMP